MPSFTLPMPRHLDANSFQQMLLHNIDTFIFDADGVLWLGEQAIPGSSDFVNFLAKNGKRIIVLTNNATKSRAVYARKLGQLGFGRCVNEHNIVNPAAVVADLLHRAGLGQGSDKKVYLIGGQGVKDEMDQLGIDHFGDGFDPVDEQPASKGSAFLYDLELEEKLERVGAVVVGYEKYFNYLKLMKASNYLRNEDCMFVATNEDETCPGPIPNMVIPDAGPLVAAVKTASGRDPQVVGKPNTPAFDYICRRWTIDPRRTLMVGDRLNTDVKFGNDHGLRSMLVLSGCHGVDDIMESQMQGRDDLMPDFYANSLGALMLKSHGCATKKEAAAAKSSCTPRATAFV
ncbi:hypothetical protein niasHT_000708 [Heterodera trifolii]|uniref:Phosphoglycolate phosphatase n=1 Tax=Heterodera trifolii TaxID=157864 RepID=A0ABD2MBV3_9BILA